MFYQIFLSPQVKRYAIITYKHGIYVLPYELPNSLRKLVNISKVSKLHSMIPHCPAPCQNENFVNPNKKLLNKSN